MNVPKILDAIGKQIRPVLKLTTNKKHACAAQIETNEIGALIVERSELNLAVLHPGDVLLQLTQGKNLQDVTVSLLFLDQDVLVPVHSLKDDLPPLFFLTHVLNTNDYQLRRVGKEQQRFRHLLRRLPTEDIDLASLTLGKLPLSFLDQPCQFGLFTLLPQQQFNQLHLLKIPEVLIVKTRDRLVLVFEIAQPPTLAVASNAE